MGAIGASSLLTVTGALKLANRRLMSGAYMDGGMGDGGGCHPRDNIALLEPSAGDGAFIHGLARLRSRFDLLPVRGIAVEQSPDDDVGMGLFAVLGDDGGNALFLHLRGGECGAGSR